MSRQSRPQEQATAAATVSARRPVVSTRALFPWLPVALGCGICFYFTLAVEPSSIALGSAGGASIVLLALRTIAPFGARPVLLGLAAILFGFALAGARAHGVAAPVLGYRYYGPVEGRVIAIDRSASDAVRLTLDRVWLGRLSPERTPARVRISLHGDQQGTRPVPGQRVMLTAHLSPPEGPVEPGGFDFRRLAWFDRLGAVGYARSPVLGLAPPQSTGAASWLYARRLALSQGLQDRIGAPEGAFASAILTGDRAGLDQERVRDLRLSNLAHLLAISGLHMGLLTGAVFFLLRAAGALIPRVALTLPLRKMAAAGALVAAFAYLFVSGGNVATQRAFVMAALMLGALLLDRQAISLANVAWAALIVLLLTPEAVLGAGFQMSFAATVALVAGFAAVRDTGWTRIPRALKGAAAVALSSAVAGAATAPFAAAHFNIWATYGLLANLAAVPVMGLLVMPGALLALALWPVGLEGAGLWCMDLGIKWILLVADRVADLDGAVRYVPAPNAMALPLIALGGLMLALGPWSWLRATSAAPLVLALVLWSQSTRPEVLVSSSGGLIGVLTPAGRVISKEKGEGFAATNWLQNDGDGAVQATAFARPGFAQSRARSDTSALGLMIVQVRGKSAPATASTLCAPGLLVISPETIGPLPGGCMVLDRGDFRQGGALAMHQGPDGPVLTWALTQRRLWSGIQTRRTQAQRQASSQ